MRDIHQRHSLYSLQPFHSKNFLCSRKSTEFITYNSTTNYSHLHLILHPFITFPDLSLMIALSIFTNPSSDPYLKTKNKKSNIVLLVYFASSNTAAITLRSLGAFTKRLQALKDSFVT